MTGPNTGFSQPIKFQVMGATTQHQCKTQIQPIYNRKREIEVGPWREGPSSTTGQGETNHDRPRYWVFTANKVPSNGCYHPTPMWNTIYRQSKIVTEELRWVHGEKGQVAQQDRVKTTMTIPDTWWFPQLANKVPSNGCCHPTPMWNTIYRQSKIVTEDLRWVHGEKGQVASMTWQGDNHHDQPRQGFHGQ
jgi:hypothetical protein